MIPAGRFRGLGRANAAYRKRWFFPADEAAQRLIATFDKLEVLLGYYWYEAEENYGRRYCG